MWSDPVSSYADLLESSPSLWSVLDGAGAGLAVLVAAVMMWYVYSDSKRSHVRTMRLLAHAKRTGKASDIMDATDSIGEVRPVFGGLGIVVLIAASAIVVCHALLHWQALGEIEARGSLLRFRAYKSFFFAEVFAIVALLLAGSYWWQHSNLEVPQPRRKRAK